MRRRYASALVLLLAAVVHALQPDANMAPTYELLSKRCVNLHTKLQRPPPLGLGAVEVSKEQVVALAQHDSVV